MGKMRSCCSNMNQTTAMTRNYLIMNADGKDIIEILMNTMELVKFGISTLGTQSLFP